jgi:hypothetical protein
MLWRNTYAAYVDEWYEPSIAVDIAPGCPYNAATPGMHVSLRHSQ